MTHSRKLRLNFSLSIKCLCSPFTKQTAACLKPTITANSHQMFLLYSGVKTLHQKPLWLFLLQTLQLSCKFTGYAPFYVFMFIQLQTCPRKNDNKKNPVVSAAASEYYRSHFHQSAEISSLSGRLSEPSLFPWHLSLGNQHWRHDSSCILGRSSGGVVTAAVRVRHSRDGGLWPVCC